MTTEQRQARLWCIQQSLKEREMEKLDLKHSIVQAVKYDQQEALELAVATLRMNRNLIEDLKFEAKTLQEALDFEAVAAIS